MKNNKNIVSTDEDYGFTFADNVFSVEEIEQAKSEYEERIDELLSVVYAFLDTLAKNPEKETIKWPNRAKRIQEFKEKLNKIAKG